MRYWLSITNANGTLVSYYLPYGSDRDDAVAAARRERDDGAKRVEYGYHSDETGEVSLDVRNYP